LEISPRDLEQPTTVPLNGTLEHDDTHQLMESTPNIGVFLNIYFLIGVNLYR
jgi:hypothetical protein